MLTYLPVGFQSHFVDTDEMLAPTVPVAEVEPVGQTCRLPRCCHTKLLHHIDSESLELRIMEMPVRAATKGLYKYTCLCLKDKF